MKASVNEHSLLRVSVCDGCHEYGPKVLPETWEMILEAFGWEINEEVEIMLCPTCRKESHE